MPYYGACITFNHTHLEGKTALKPLVAHPQLVNLVDRLPAAERWTHYFAGGKRGEKTK